MPARPVDDRDPVHARVSGGDSHAAGRARQHLKLAAIGYANARHGIDASDDLLRGAVTLLCQKAVDFVETLSRAASRISRLGLERGDHETLRLAAIAYACVRHGIDADVGMAREGLAVLCQAAIAYVESLPREETPKRSSQASLQIGGSPTS
jgi:hypothetical protein